ncbi:hypothetical protein [Kitasatospora sp. GAS204B]|uniref:hypothetical protein n=1 Tax=unclassified Kitasatospora TaxID=2633591 RepID=UPI002475E58D|nr:hypothetical protein [Kitasatospora sp. GAS204B]MDH6117228.1 hypothetical protein [Kitasatospora sp. GAS204B]
MMTDAVNALQRRTSLGEFHLHIIAVPVAGPLFRPLATDHQVLISTELLRDRAAHVDRVVAHLTSDAAD